MASFETSGAFTPDPEELGLEPPAYTAPQETDSAVGDVTLGAVDGNHEDFKEGYDGERPD